MKNNITKLLTILLTVLCLTLLVGCDMTYTVKFSANGGTFVDGQTEIKVEVNDGSLVEEPEKPTRAGYIFMGWHRKDHPIDLWDFDTDKVGENITLNAVWTPDDGNQPDDGNANIPHKHSFTNYISNNDAKIGVDGTKTAKCDKCAETNTITDVGSMIVPENGTNGLQYTLNSDNNSYSATGIGTVTDSSITIANIYNGLPVTSIGDAAFLECRNLLKVVIPDGITSIGRNAFTDCYNLSSIKIGNSITTIGEYAFELCMKLNDITMGSNIAIIGKAAFSSCDNLVSMVIGDKVTSIGEESFYGCSNLTNITLGKGVKAIGDEAFKNCHKLVKVLNKSSLDIIKGSSENGYVGNYALDVSSDVNSNSKINYTDDGYIFYEDNNIVYLLGYQGAENVLTLPQKHNGKNYGIYNYAFYDREELLISEIPDGVISIGNYAFAECGRTILSKIIIPDSVTSIGDCAFIRCTALNSVTIGKNVQSIGANAFDYCYKLVEVYNKSSLNIVKGSTDNGYIAYYASDVYTDTSVKSKIDYDDNGYIFYINGDEIYLIGCSNIDKTISLPESYNGKEYAIYEHAFLYYPILSIYIPKGVTKIGYCAFYGCEWLTNIYYNGTKEEWSAIEKAFYWNFETGEYVVHCTNGDITKAEY